MTLGMNHPMGPLRLADFIGLDTVLQIAEVLHAEFRDPAVRAAAAAATHGRARDISGRRAATGFYEYD